MNIFGQELELPDGEIQPDDPVLYQLDQLIIQEYANNDPTLVERSSTSAVPYPSEDEIELRLIDLDRTTPLELTYNKVVSAYIKMYADRKRTLTEDIMGRTELYYPIFERIFDNADIPLEIKHLAVVESALNPKARSRMGATGLWQFMLYTGKQYGLSVNSYVDERYDPIASTEAAAAYLTYLNGLYNDWNLALAAYNCGPGNVNKAIRRSGGKRDYWKIYPYLPRETRGYVPAFIAVNYVLAYADQHGLVPREPMYRAYEVDTLRICYAADFGKVEQFSGIPVEELRYLNPMYKKGFIPEPEQPVCINIPRKKVGAYLANEENICYFRSESELARVAEAAKANEPVETERITHIVRRGQSLGLIAQRYGVSVRSIMNTNGLRSTRIRAGQRLYVDKRVRANKKKLSSSAKASTGTSKPTPATDITGDVTYFFYTIKSGDTVWDIAKLYSGVSVDQIKKLNIGMNWKRLNPGDKIRIPAS